MMPFRGYKKLFHVEQFFVQGLENRALKREAGRFRSQKCSTWNIFLYGTQVGDLTQISLSSRTKVCKSFQAVRRAGNIKLASVSYLPPTERYTGGKGFGLSVPWFGGAVIG
jgi:hypothetical protein